MLFGFFCHYLVTGPVLEKHEQFSAPCSAGDYMTDTGCQQCEENTYSGAEASECTSCPDGKISAAGSTTEDDCQYGLFFE